MRYSQSEKGITIQLESDDDLWHLYNIVELGDLVTASTMRRDEKARNAVADQRTEKRRMTLGIRAEKIEFSEEDLRLRILGVIEEGPQDIGQHHSLMMEVGERVTVGKKHVGCKRNLRVEILEESVFSSRTDCLLGVRVQPLYSLRHNMCRSVSEYLASLGIAEGVKGN